MDSYRTANENNQVATITPAHNPHASNLSLMSPRIAGGQTTGKAASEHPRLVSPTAEKTLDSSDPGKRPLKHNHLKEV